MLFKLALCPAFIILLYIYYRDKNEKEPIYLYSTAVVMGMISIGIVLGLDIWLMRDLSGLKGVLYNSFVTSAFTEESVKYLFLFLITYKNPNFNTPLDSVVYAVAVSLGFAAAENLIYVLDPIIGGFKTAVSRSIFSVPAHAVFAVSMGVYYEKAAFHNQKNYFIAAFLMPFLMHGIYNVILLSDRDKYLLVFIPYMIYLYFYGLKSIRHLKYKRLEKSGT